MFVSLLSYVIALHVYKTCLSRHCDIIFWSKYYLFSVTQIAEMNLTLLVLTKGSTKAVLQTDKCFLCELLQKLPNALPLNPSLPYVSLDQLQLPSAIRNQHINPFLKVHLHFLFNGNLYNNIRWHKSVLLKVCKFGRNNEGCGADDSRIYICISALKTINNCNYSANRKQRWEG